MADMNEIDKALLKIQNDGMRKEAGRRFGLGDPNVEAALKIAQAAVDAGSRIDAVSLGGGKFRIKVTDKQGNESDLGIMEDDVAAAFLGAKKRE